MRKIFLKVYLKHVITLISIFLQTVNLAALGIVGGNVSIGNATAPAAPVAKKRPSTSTLGTIAINDIIATRTHPTPVSDGQVTVSVGNQDTQKTPITTGRIGYGTF